MGVVMSGILPATTDNGPEGSYGRARWGKSSRQALPFAVINLEWKKLFFPLLAVSQWIMLSVLLAMSLSGVFFTTHAAYLWFALGSYLAIRYAETAQYVIRRPEMSRTTKLVTWLWVTPVEMVVKALVIYPAKYWAILKLRERGWHTRGNAHATNSTSVPDRSRALVP